MAERDDVSERTVTWQWSGVAVFVLLIIAFPAYRLVESGWRNEALAQRQSAQVATGREVWGNSCASCHGTDGFSDEVATPSLNSQQFLTVATDDQIHHVIAAGIPGTEMPAWWVEFGGSLTDDQIRATVAYMRSWTDTAPDLPDWQNLPTAMEHPGPDEEPGGESSSGPSEVPPSESPGPSQAPPSEAPPSEAPPSEPTDRNVVAVSMDDVVCEPLEFDVDAGQPVTVEVDNRGTGSYSFAIDALDLHEHTPPGEVTTIELTFDQEGEYGFECLGSGHGSVLGIGVIRAN